MARPQFVKVKPKGYAAMVAEHGKSLSVGERQRLSSARAMPKDEPILMLDEATRALGNVTEACVQRPGQRDVPRSSARIGSRRERDGGGLRVRFLLTAATR
jgi:ABC-type transport system involved in Fe-S cluster assembly fused permease/ATPase subunit